MTSNLPAIRLPAPGRAAAALALFVLVAAVVTVREADRPSSDAGAPDVPARVVGIELDVPRGWTQDPARRRVPGFDFRDAVALRDPATQVRLVAGVLPFTSPTLLPAGVVRRLQLPADPKLVRLGNGLRAYQYGGLLAEGSSTVLEVYAVPTSRGVATVACSSTDPGAVIDACANAARTLRIEGPRALVPGRDVAFRQQLVDTVEQIDADRARARRSLRRTRAPERQAAIVAGLTRRYATAAATLAPLLAPANGRHAAIVREMLSAAAAFTRATDALRHEDPSAFLRSRRAASRVERRLARLVRSMPGPPVQ